MTKLIAYGDSIFAGWDGKESLPASERIPEMIGQAMGWDVTNTAISGAQFDDRGSGFPAMAKSHSAADYDYALVNFGVNNWCFPSGNLDYVKQRVEAGIDTLKQESPNIKILLELPTEDFRNGSTSLFDFNSQNWSQYQLDSMLVDVANEKGIDYYDWRPDPIITYDNASTALGDGSTGVHPTADTGRKIADRLIAKFQEMAGTTPAPAPTPQPAPDPQPQPTPVPDPTPDPQPQPQPQPQPAPAVKTVNEIELDSLADIFGIGDNVSSGTHNVVAKLNELYGLLESLVGSDKTEVQAPLISPGDAPSRSLRNYVIQTFAGLNEMVNDFIQTCNSHWIIDPMTGDHTSTICLSRPESLELNDDYVSAINNGWQAIETVINKLIGYINQIRVY